MAFKFLGDICRRGLSSAALDETLNRWGWRPLLADQIEWIAHWATGHALATHGLLNQATVCCAYVKSVEKVEL